MLAPVTILAATDEIRAAIGIVALLHAGGELSAADVSNAIRLIERRTAEIEALADGVVLMRDLPIMTRGEVVARAKHRARPARPALQPVKGDRS